jgi:hypothetical protein
VVPADAATPRRPWAGVQPLGPRPEQPADAATPGRRRLHSILPLFRHVERRVLSLVYVSLWPNSNILRIRPIYVRTRLYILNISKFHLSLNIFCLFMFEFVNIRSFPWTRCWENGPPQAKFYIHPTLNSTGFWPGESQRLEMLLGSLHLVENLPDIAWGEFFSMPR